MTRTLTFHVNGMHCNACVMLTETALKEVQGIEDAKTSLKDQRVEVTGAFEEKTPEQIATALNAVLKPHGYTLTLEASTPAAQWSDFRVAIPVATAFIVFFILLQKLGVVNLVTSSNVTYGTAFVIGFIASISTCMAVVGGLVLSMSANFAKGGDHIRPQMRFHVGRLVSFFVLGGVIGALGSVFQFGAVGSLILGLVVALVLLILGINLLDVFPWAKKLQLTMPNILGKQAHGLKDMNHTLTPFLVGIATFFLPCGFTQSMQLYTLTTGDFWTGAFTMTAFALGTLPVLSLLSFSALGIHKKAQSGVFFKSAGLIVMFFSIFNLLNTLAAAGLISPVFSF